jgi:excinuclease ABC subunit A
MVSLNEGACTLLQFKRFKRYQKQFLDFCEQQGISTELPFYQIETDQVWEKIEKGGKDFKGLRSIYEILEKKRYKKPYRIFARKFKSEFVCESCLGTRLEKDLFNYYLPSDGGRLSYLDILKRPLSELLNSLKVCTIKDRLLEELITKLSITIELGLSHLCLTDNAKQLSTSEYQRLLLVKFFSYQGSGSLFILDEPSVGLSSKEQRVLLKFLKKLKEKGNTVLIIEHSTFLQKNADEIIWMGPKAGRLGGEVVYQGNWKKQFSILPKALKAKPSKSKGSLEIYKAKFRNFTIDTFKLPLRTLTYIKGDSSSGASEFFNIVVSNEISQKLSGDLINFERYSVEQFKLKGELKKIIVFSYEARSFSARSTIGTLLGITPMIRKYYSSLHESKVMNLKDGHFSPNSDMGKCRSCEGRGIQAIEMDILEDVTFTCPDCGGKKIVPLYADISDGEQSFYEAISQAMDNILSRIKLTPKFIRIFDYIKKLRLEYLSLDRSFNSLSGGEKQRILLLLEVLKGEDKAFYLFENLSTGLSIEDLYYVAIFLQDIVDQGNTVVIMDQHTLWDGVAQTKIDFSN